MNVEKMAGNSRTFLISEESLDPDSMSTVPIDEPYAANADPDANWPIAESYRQYLIQFAQITEEEQMSVGPVGSTWEIARGRIAKLVCMPGLDSEGMGIECN
jgi:hypothetical protein